MLYTVLSTFNRRIVVKDGERVKRKDRPGYASGSAVLWLAAKESEGPRIKGLAEGAEFEQQ
jgi:hypothetical protein